MPITLQEMNYKAHSNTSQFLARWIIIVIKMHNMGHSREENEFWATLSLTPSWLSAVSLPENAVDRKYSEWLNLPLGNKENTLASVHIHTKLL